MSLTFLSIADAERLPAARVLAADLRAAHPEARILVATRPGAEPTDSEPFEALPAGGEPAPRLLRRLLDEGAGTVVLVDPMTAVYAALDPLLEFAVEHGVAAAGTLLALASGPAADALVVAWTGSHASGAAAVQDAGVQASARTLAERRLVRRDGGIRVGDALLRSFSFAGLRADRPYWLGDDVDRALVVADPVLAELCGEYAQRLRDAGWAPPVADLGGVTRLGNGQRVDHLMRRLWRDHVAEEGFGDPSRARDAEAFVAWLRAPAERGAAHGVNRYLAYAYGTRPDLQDAFPDLDGADGARFMDWAWEHGTVEILAELLPPARGDGGLYERYRLGVNVVGYLNDTLGLAEAARLYVDGLAAAGVPVTTTAIRPDMALGPGEAPVHHRSGHQDYAARRSDVDPAFNLVCANGDQLEAFIRGGGAQVLAGRPTIGQWGWETDVLPQSWLAAFAHLDEIWVYTSFVAENLARVSPVPVVVVPMAISVPDVAGVEVEMLRDERFTFLFMLDMFSTLRRKNALGLVRAFTRAFAPGEGPRLLIKTINAAERPQAHAELRHEAAGRPDVDLVDGYLDAREKSALLAGADCFVSLHRSEGFGLGLAEAMALGTPVIATGYSGNLDFMTPHNSWLVDSTPARVGPNAELYPASGTWAEPDLDHAAELMRHVFAHPDEAARRARRARTDIERRYSPQVTGAIARGRLERLVDARAAARLGGDGAGALRTIESELAVDLRLGAAPIPGGIEGRVRRAVLRLITPFTYHQRALDRAMFDVVRNLRDELDHERRERRNDRGRLRALEDAVADRGERR